MLARLQQVIAIGLFGGATVWGVFLAMNGRPGWAAGGVLSIALTYSGFLALEFLLAGLANRSDPAPPASPREWVVAWWHEVSIAPRVFLWRQPFLSRAIPDWLPSAPDQRRGVLLVHGFVCNRGFWNPWMTRLRARGNAYVAVTLEPVFGSIDAYIPLIDGAIRQLERSTGVPPLIVAHSMGGLAVRAWLARCEGRRRVHQIITVGTPHAGTRLARLAFSLNGRQMRRDGRWFRELLECESHQQLPPFICFYSQCDNVVFPASTATMPGADNRHVSGCAHVDLMFQPVVFNEVLQALDASATVDA